MNYLTSIVCTWAFGVAAISATARADGQPVPQPTAGQSSPAGSSESSRFGLFNWLDQRSAYGQGVFPEPFLVDDSDLEPNEARLDWLHTEGNNQRSDSGKAEIEKGFGLMTLELEIPYTRNVSDGQTMQGFNNVSVGARFPFHQFVSRNGYVDSTTGGAIEVGIPVNSAVSQNTEVVPKVFNDLRFGDHFTLQSILGYSTQFGGEPDGGLQTFEYGFVFGWTIPHREMPLPVVLEFIPLFELKGETELNKDHPGHDILLGNAAFRVNLKAIGQVQPRLGLGFVFPIDKGARADLSWGTFTSLVFQF